MLKALLNKCFRMQLLSRKYLLTVNYLLLMVFIALQALLLQLGYWQLDRAQEKEQIIQDVEHMRRAEVVALEQLNQPKDYQPVSFSASVFPHTVLVANEPNKGRDGYNVLRLIQLSNENFVWLNQGWVEALADRRNLPTLNPLPDNIDATGEIYYSKGEPVLFDGALQKFAENLWVLQGFSFDYLKTIPLPSNSKLLPFIIRLDPDEEFELIRNWQYIAMPPEKHLAYAIQWFGLAVALLIIFLATSIKKSNDDGL